MLEDGMSYILAVEYTTHNLYTESREFKFTVIQNTLNKLKVKLELDTNNELGSIRVKMIATDSNKYNGYITFRRASSKTQFSVWEDVHTVKLQTQSLNYEWYDYTVESGVWYKYCVQKRDPAGNRGIVTIVENPIMIIFEDMFLAANKEQLRIKYNPQISSYKKNVS